MPTFTTKEIRLLFKKARRVLKHSGLDVLSAPATLDQGRLLVITSRKVGNAPQRNKIRRRIKAIFHEEQLAKLKQDIIVIVKKEGIKLSFEELKKLLIASLEK